MSQPVIRIRIDAKGKGRIITEGVEGTNCMDFSKALEEALGANPETVEYTSEYYGNNRERAVVIRQSDGQ